MAVTNSGGGFLGEGTLEEWIVQRVVEWFRREAGRVHKDDSAASITINIHGPASFEDDGAKALTATIEEKVQHEPVDGPIERK